MANDQVKDGEGFSVYHRYACARVTGITGRRITILHPLREPIDQAAWVRRSSGQPVRAYSRFCPLDRRVRDFVGGRIWLVAGQCGVASITRHELGSVRCRQPLTLPLAPLSRQNFQLAQRLIRDVSDFGMSGLVGRLIGHLSHSNGGLDDGSHWLTKRSVRAAHRQVTSQPTTGSHLMDLMPLRPRSDTPDATLEAINRCTIAISGCVATITQLRQDRAALLMTGQPAQLRQNATALAETISDAAEIRDLSDHLQERLQQQAPEQVAEVAAQKRAIEAAEAASAWWTSNIGLVTDGLHKIGTAFAAFADLQLAVARTNAVAEAARATAVNVVALTPRPVA